MGGLEFKRALLDFERGGGERTLTDFLARVRRGPGSGNGETPARLPVTWD
ncbi:hypothetical protein D187_006790 [Cystobacter fuscus DSM 2262]|uniref:Uncharacterized protein n=1 Tax=Cystobacter fuscus (strain ATCC 25194 / DSM 2262 / NBRC 100088 / M29) TaxID=1242864 RepID=S9P1P2_CYSF2|nr:hypothetical protein D187_006790 [Cystobacter fuscus DSM 2262]